MTEPKVTLNAWLSSDKVSSTPYTVTVWAVFQLEVEKLNVEEDTVPSVLSLLVTGNETDEVGAMHKCTEKVALSPVSVMFPLMDEIFKSAFSSFEAEILWLSAEYYEAADAVSV